MKPDIDFLSCLPELANAPIEQVVEELLAGQIEKDTIDLTIRRIVQSRYRFSATQLSRLKVNALQMYFGKEGNRLTFAHQFAWIGYRFTLAELLEMGNHQDKNGISIAHFMVLAGHVFNVDELLQLKNPAEGSDRSTVAHWMALFGHKFSVAELLALGNPERENRVTVAHEMASQGHQFSPADIDKLGNPISYQNETLDKAWELWKSHNNLRQQNSTSTNIMRLLWKNGEPMFEISNYDGQGTSLRFVVAFGWFSKLDMNFHCDNAFLLQLRPNFSGWMIDIEETHKTDNYNFLYQKALVLELVKKFNLAIHARKNYDFADYIERIIDTRFEICPPTPSGYWTVEVYLAREK